LTFDVNGSAAPFPNSGTWGIDCGSTSFFTLTLTVRVAEDEMLNVFVSGKEEDDDCRAGRPRGHF
jgi:hypothetical protein